MNGFTIPEDWKTYNMHGYSKPSNKRMNPYRRFNEFIFKNTFNFIIARLIDSNSIGDIRTKPLSKYKMQIYSKACATVWNFFIINTFISEYAQGIDPKSKEFEKLKKKNIKMIDDLVSGLILHLNHHKADADQARLETITHLCNTTISAIMNAAHSLDKQEIFQGHNQRPTVVTVEEIRRLFIDAEYHNNEETEGRWVDHNHWNEEDRSAFEDNA